MTAPVLMPVLILGHDGLDPALFGGLEGAFVRDGRGARDDLLAGMAGAWETLDGFGPLRGQRDLGRGDAARRAGPPHPWYGAEATDPRGLARALGPALISHVIDPPPGTVLPVLLSRRIFWERAPCLALAQFVLTALPEARLLLPLRDRAAARACFVAASGWRAEAADSALALMEDHAQALAAQFPDRSLIWTLPPEPEPESKTDIAPVPVPAAVARFITAPDRSPR